MMLGLLLARAGVPVVVLEKHADFLRDFRGDTIHPSTLEVMHELGVLDDFLKLPHQKVRELVVQIDDIRLPVADFTHLPTRCGFIAFMPQWDFLNFLAERARRYPTFELRMRAEVIGLIEEAGRVVGVEVDTPEGRLEVQATLVIAADGRHSVVRREAGLRIEELGAPMDVLWFRLARRPEDAVGGLGRFTAGRLFIMLNRGEYWQCGFVIAKGTIDEIRQAGLEAFRAEVARLAAVPRDRVSDIRSWDDVKLLTVLVDRLPTWYRSGLLCLGDAAHAMSPVGGVGINLAIQDAVAAANILAAPLRDGSLSLEQLQQVQQRRLPATRIVQRLQILVQDRIVTPVLGSRARKLSVPLALRLLVRIPLLRRIPGRLVGMGVRPEHVRI